MRTALSLGILLATLVLGGCGTVGQRLAGVDNFDEVSPTLYRGAQPSAAGVQMLAARHVKTVINLRDGDDTAEAREVREAGMTYFRLPLDAEKVTEADAEKFLALLDAAPKPAFVHCLVGRDRTGMAVAAYRVRVQGWEVKDAVADMNAHGHFWVFFPKVREAIVKLGKTPPKIEQVAEGFTVESAPAAR